MTFDPRESLVLSMIEKLLKNGKQVNIDLKSTTWAAGNHQAISKGEITDVNYWSTENVLSIDYLYDDYDGKRRADWRFRPLTTKIFDDSFTLKKINDVLTLVKKERVEEAHEHKPMILRIIEKLYNRGEVVYLKLGQLRYQLNGITSGQDVYSGRFWNLEFLDHRLGGVTVRQFDDQSDSKWRIEQEPEGWNLYRKEEVTEVIKSRPGKKEEPAFPMDELTISGQIAYNTIFKHLKDGRPVRVNFDGDMMNEISGLLSKLEPNGDYLRVKAEWPDDEGQIWTSSAVWLVKDFNQMKLKTTEYDGQKVLHVIRKGGKWDEAA